MNLQTDIVTADAPPGFTHAAVRGHHVIKKSKSEKCGEDVPHVWNSRSLPPAPSSKCACGKTTWAQAEKLAEKIFNEKFGCGAAATETADIPKGDDTDTWLGGFVVKEENYPNGWKMLVVWRGKTRIGNCQPVAGGYLVNGKRKPVASLLLAAKQMIDDGMNKCRAEENKWRKMMNALKNECGSIPPNADLRQDAGSDGTNAK